MRIYQPKLAYKAQMEESMVEIRWEGGGRRADLVFGRGGRVQEVSGGKGPLHIKYLVPGYQWRTWYTCAIGTSLTVAHLVHMRHW